MAEKIAYLGPGGTFCEQAARQYRGEKELELLPLPSLRQVFQAVAAGDVCGSIMFLAGDTASAATDSDVKLINVAAGFLGRQMEE